MNIGKNINGLYEKDVKKACIFFTERQKIKRIKKSVSLYKAATKGKNRNSGYARGGITSPCVRQLSKKKEFLLCGKNGKNQDCTES